MYHSGIWPCWLVCVTSCNLYHIDMVPLSGDGKSHLIRTRLRNRLSHMVLNIPVSEGFTPLSAIKKLQSLPMDTRGCCIYFNFTMLPPSVNMHVNHTRYTLHVYILIGCWCS